MSTLEIINQEITTEISKTEIANQLLATTFKGLSAPVMKQALFEGMTRGFTFKDFLEKNVYAIPYSSGYSLITSIDYARKIGQRSGVNGKSKPIYTETENGKVKTCSVTIYKKDGHPEGYTAEVYFDEYSTNKNLWLTKPRTMIAKVAEMHALRMACPEETAQLYVEEEMQKSETPEVSIDLVACAEKLEAATSLDDLKAVWRDFTPNERNSEELKTLFVTQKNKIASEISPA